MNGSELEALKESARVSGVQLRILGVLSSGPSYVAAIAQAAQISEETARRNLMPLKRLGYVTNWTHTFHEGTLRNIAVSAWRLLTDQERLEGRIDSNRHRRSLKTLDAKIRFRFRRTRELHNLLRDAAKEDAAHTKGESVDSPEKALLSTETPDSSQTP